MVGPLLMWSALTLVLADPAVDVWEILHADPAARAAAQLQCPAGDGTCAITRRYSADKEAAALALEMWERWGHVAGEEQAWVMDGAYRGSIRIVGELPTGGARRHLRYVHGAVQDHDAFLRRVFQGCAQVRYRWRALGFRFFRSIKRQTPSAYAGNWTIAYNLQGSLNTSAPNVRELLFHELFHLNDQQHGDWAASSLGPLHLSLKARCRGDVRCLKPYSPTETRVKGGNWYAFHADNGPSEYAAELALRYYRENREAFGGATVARPFKCINTDNARAWKLLVEEFFCGQDAVPACP